jgi:hypothetical protein
VVANKVEHVAGQDARFECRIRANPLTNFYWSKNDQIIENSVMTVGDAVLHAHEQASVASMAHSNNFIERKTLKYEAMIFNQNEHLTVITLVVKVNIHLNSESDWRIAFNSTYFGAYLICILYTFYFRQFINVYFIYFSII